MANWLIPRKDLRPKGSQRTLAVLYLDWGIMPPKRPPLSQLLGLFHGWVLRSDDGGTGLGFFGLSEVSQETVAIAIDAAARDIQMKRAFIEREGRWNFDQ